MKRLKRFFKLIPLFMLVIAFALFFYLGGHHYLSLEALKSHRHALVSWTHQHYFLSSLLFIFIYIFMVAISAPNASFLTILGGFLFGPIVGGIYVVFSAAIGASLIFLAAKTAFYDYFHQKAKGQIKKMEQGFKKNAVRYLLFLRLVPIFPFWLVNILPAFFGVSLRTFFITTLIGIIPGTFVYAFLGSGVGQLMDQGQAVNMGIIFDPMILLPIVGLAILALLPVIFKKN